MSQLQKFIDSDDFQNVPDTDWAWLAGFLEGEGYLALLRRSPAANKRCKNEMGGITVTLRVGNSDMLAMDYIEGAFPKHSAVTNIDHAGLNRPMRAVHWTGARAGAMCHYLIPHMVGEKRRKAEILVEWSETLKGYGRNGLDDETIAKRGALIAEMDSLKAPRKKRGRK